MCCRVRSARQNWRNGPIRCTSSLRPRQWRPTCLTWTAFCTISLTPCSPWHRSHVPGPVTDMTVSTQHFKSDFQPWLCIGLKYRVKWLTVSKNTPVVARELHDTSKFNVFMHHVAENYFQVTLILTFSSFNFSFNCKNYTLKDTTTMSILYVLYVIGNMPYVTSVSAKNLFSHRCHTKDPEWTEP